jgi:hypothetical protein
MTKPSTPSKAELHEMLAEAVRNTQPRPVRNEQPAPVGNTQPEPKRNPGPRKRPTPKRTAKIKAFGHLLAASGSIDNAATLRMPPKRSRLGRKLCIGTRRSCGVRDFPRGAFRYAALGYALFSVPT